jgi:Ca-activated chloride channel family protein
MSMNGDYVLDTLIVAKAITMAQAEAARQSADATGLPMCAALEAAGVMDEEQALRAMADEFQTEYVDLSACQLPHSITAALPRELACRYEAIPVSRNNSSLTVAIADPEEGLDVADALSYILRTDMIIVFAKAADVRRALAIHYHHGPASQALDAKPEPGFGALDSDQGPLPLKAMDVSVDITGLAYSLELRQSFVNTHDVPLQATYIFPLPDRGAVSAFQLRADNRTVKGMLRERGQARQEYSEALEQGRRAAIAEEERPDVFTLRVGNIMPGETAQIELSLDGMLPVADGEATFRFPLVVAPRYIPGTPLPADQVGDGTSQDTDQVPDASRISPPILLPGYPNPVRLSLQVRLDPAGLPVRNVQSSCHTTTVREENGATRLDLLPGERLDRDFVLRFEVGNETSISSLVVCPDPEECTAGEHHGTFLLTVVPPMKPDAQTRPRDVVFVLDHSGSMGGWKMVAARRAMARMVESLTTVDRFAVLIFDDTMASPPRLSAGKLAPATAGNRIHAADYLMQVVEDGGTEMARPLRQAARLLGESPAERDALLVLVTDGEIGNEREVLRELAPALARIRVFPLGIGPAANGGFLNRLAAVGGGVAELVESENRLEEVMDRVHRRIGTPALTDLCITCPAPGILPNTLSPARLPDLFPGTPLYVFGRCRCATDCRPTVSATTNDGAPWTGIPTPVQAENPAIAKLWARARILDLQDQSALDWRKAPGLEDEIVRTSLRFGVLSSQTAFVAVDEKVANTTGDLENVIQPVEMPHASEESVECFLEDITGDILGMDALFCGPDLEDAGEEDPVEQLVALLFLENRRTAATDTYLDPVGDEVRVWHSFIDTVEEVETYPLTLHEDVVARIKEMAQLDPARHDIRQEGHIKVQAARTEFSLLITILPTACGEAVIIHVEDADPAEGVPEALQQAVADVQAGHTDRIQVVLRQDGIAAVQPAGAPEQPIPAGSPWTRASLASLLCRLAFEHRGTAVHLACEDNANPQHFDFEFAACQPTPQ